MSDQPKGFPAAGPILSTDQRLARMESQLSEISAQLSELVSAQRPIAELKDEMGPIGREVMATAIAQMEHLEERGYFAFGKELMYLIDRIVEDYSPQDLHELADHAANILDTVRSLSQPSVMSVIREVAETFEEARNPEPKGLFGAWSRIRKEKNVQRGIGFALDVLGRVGRSVSRAPRFSRSDGGSARPAALPAPPRRERAPVSSERPASQSQTVHAPQATFPLIPDNEWSRDYAQSLAHDLGVGELGDGHWKLVSFARADYKENGAAPNIRRITASTGVSTRDVYGLFPKAPGLTISRLAGIPKPAGCL
ncbi:MAG: TusE/DsrC/DsvC family sulfur relay protein [Myxococcales bacterium]|nr:TusE/DsrC/DsvC family sulfur relay protein [Myxococcales bacterium]